MFTTEMFILMGESLLETLYMTLVAAAVSYVLGLPLGLILVVTDADGIRPNAPVNRILGTIINALRSVPFLILLFTVIPVTRFITGTTITSPVCSARRNSKCRKTPCPVVSS